MLLDREELEDFQVCITRPRQLRSTTELLSWLHLIPSQPRMPRATARERLNYLLRFRSALVRRGCIIRDGLELWRTAGDVSRRQTPQQIRGAKNIVKIIAIGNVWRPRERLRS
jgi:hypothetical protein